MDSWGVLACYPWRTFDPLREGHSTKDLRIIRTDLPSLLVLYYSQSGRHQGLTHWQSCTQQNAAYLCTALVHFQSPPPQRNLHPYSVPATTLKIRVEKTKGFRVVSHQPCTNIPNPPKDIIHTTLPSYNPKTLPPEEKGSKDHTTALSWHTTPLEGAPTKHIFQAGTTLSRNPHSRKHRWGSPPYIPPR